MSSPIKPLAMLARFCGRQRAASTEDAVLRIQPQGLNEAQLGHLRALLAPLEARLSVPWQLVGSAGDVVLVPSGQRARGFGFGNKADTIVCDLPQDDEPRDSIARRFEMRQRALLEQLRAVQWVRRRSPHFGASGWDPSVVDTVPASLADPEPHDEDPLSRWQAPSMPLEIERALRRLQAALLENQTCRMFMSFGPSAHIEFDFELGQAWLDPFAQQALRVHQRFPQLVESCRPGPDALPREPAEVLWDLGVAAGAHRLMAQPPDWWAVPVVARDAEVLIRYTSLPRHRQLAAMLAAGPTTPEALIRLSGAPLSQVRSFLQAALLLEQVRWLRG